MNGGSFGAVFLTGGQYGSVMIGALLWFPWPLGRWSGGLMHSIGLLPRARSLSRGCSIYRNSYEHYELHSLPGEYRVLTPTQFLGSDLLQIQVLDLYDNCGLSLFYALTSLRTERSAHPCCVFPRLLSACLCLALLY